jgi:hypothetical protein
MEPLQLLEDLEEELQTIANREHIALRQSIECGIGNIARQLITNDIRSSTSAKSKCSPSGSPVRQSVLWPVRSERSPSPMRERQQRRHASARVPGAHSVSPPRLPGGMITCSSPSAAKRPSTLLSQAPDARTGLDAVPARVALAAQDQQQECQHVTSMVEAQHIPSATKGSSDQGPLISHLVQQQDQMMHLLHSLIGQAGPHSELLSPSKV